MSKDLRSPVVSRARVEVALTPAFRESAGEHLVVKADCGAFPECSPAPNFGCMGYWFHFLLFINHLRPGRGELLLAPPTPPDVDAYKPLALYWLPRRFSGTRRSWFIRQPPVAGARSKDFREVAAESPECPESRPPPPRSRSGSAVVGLSEPAELVL
jgi:hypothetical protein